MQPVVSHTLPMPWTAGRHPDVCQEIILNQACRELGGQGAVTVYTHPATCMSFLTVCVPEKGLLEQAICILWLWGTSNWKGWDCAGRTKIKN